MFTHQSMIIQNMLMSIDGSTALNSQENRLLGICTDTRGKWLTLPTLSVKCGRVLRT